MFLQSVCAQLILPGVKLGETGNFPRPRAILGTTRWRRAGSGIWAHPTSIAPTAPVTHLREVELPLRRAGRGWGLQGQGHHPPVSRDTFLSVPLSLTCRWRFLALGVSWKGFPQIKGPRQHSRLQARPGTFHSLSERAAVPFPFQPCLSEPVPPGARRSRGS